MPAKLEPISKLNYAWPKGENDWNLGMDENLRRIGVLLQDGVISHTEAIPSSPAVGALYVVPPAPTGAWVGKAGQIATWEPSTWYFVTPRTGQVLYNTTTKGLIVYDGSTWVDVLPSDPTYVAFKASYDAWKAMSYVDTQVEVNKRTPKWYVDTYGLTMKVEFAQTQYMGLNLGWAVMMTFIGHASTASGHVRQVAYTNGGMSIRQSTSDTTWGAWATLGTAAFQNTTTSNKDDTNGAVMRIGDWGVCRTVTSGLPLENLPLSTGLFPNCSFFRVQGGDQTGHGAGVGQAVGLAAGTYLMQYLQMGNATNAHAVIYPMNVQHSMYHGTMTLNNGSTTVKRYFKFLDDNNTTVDASGFIKTASPVVRLFSDHIEPNHDAETQGLTFERVAVGHYLVKGSSGFATDGWWINVPSDSNGNKIVALTHSTLDDGTLEIKTYKRKFDIETASIVPDVDNPVDIPSNNNGEQRWIDIRLYEEPITPDDDVTDSVTP